jgi:hypothetical protein
MFAKTRGIITNVMTTEGNFSKETTIYVSTSSTLTFDQTQNVISELLHIIGYPNNYTGFKFQFVEGGDLVQANASVDSKFRVSIGD